MNKRKIKRQLNLPIESKRTTQLYLKFNNLISKLKSKYYSFSCKNISINELKFDYIVFEFELEFEFSNFYFRVQV